MNPGAIVEGLNAGVHATGLNSPKTGSLTRSAVPVPVKGQAPGQAVRTGTVLQPRNWSEEFAEQANLLTKDTVPPDIATEPDPSSSSPSFPEARQLVAPNPPASQSIENEIETLGRPARVNREGPTAKNLPEGKLSAAARAAISRSPDGSREHRAHTGATNSSSVRENRTLDLVSAPSAPPDPLAQFVNAPLPGYGLLRFLPAGGESKISSGEAHQQQPAWQSISGNFSGPEPRGNAGITRTARSDDSPDSPIVRNGGSGEAAPVLPGPGSFAATTDDAWRFDAEDSGVTDRKSAAAEIHGRDISIASVPMTSGAFRDTGLRTGLPESQELTPELAVPPGKDSQSAADVPGIDGRNGTAFANSNRTTAAAPAFEIASVTNLSSKMTGGANATNGAARESAIREANGNSNAIQQSAHDSDAQTRGYAEDSATPHEQTKPNSSATPVVSANSGLHSGVPGSAGAATHSGMEGAFVPVSHPLSDSVGLERESGSRDTPPSGAIATSNPFLSMDGAGRVALEQPASGASQLTVGHQDPVLGYIELRARADGSGVHAVLGVQSAAAGETLEGHLGSLASWMNEQHTPVESIRVWGLNAEHGTQTAFHGKDSGANGMTGGNGSGAQSGFGSSRDGGGASQRPPSDGPPELQPIATSVSAGLTLARGVSTDSVIPPARNGTGFSVLA